MDIIHTYDQRQHPIATRMNMVRGYRQWQYGRNVQPAYWPYLPPGYIYPPRLFWQVDIFGWWLAVDKIYQKTCQSHLVAVAIFIGATTTRTQLPTLPAQFESHDNAGHGAGHANGEYKECCGSNLPKNLANLILFLLPCGHF